MKKKFLHPFLVSFVISLSFLLLFQSCKKDIDSDNNGPNNPNTGFPVTIEGVISDLAGMPLQNVLVKAGSAQASTDINGNFKIEDAVFTTGETFVTATLPGYFKGSRTFFARENSNNFLKIQLLPRIQAGSLSSSSGGTVSVGTASITFPANAFNNMDGTAFTGTVSVNAAYIDPLNPSLNQQMPGDLRGIRTSGELRGLKTFGMMVVEIESAGGQQLQLKPGSPAQITLPLPSQLSASAPATVPLWYFDEVAGIWKEEGIAQKNGGQYTGSVSHFTFWNVDEPYEYVLLSMKVINLQNQAIKGAKVVLTSLVDSTSSFDYTDKDGFVDGYVPKNVQLRRDIYNECDILVHTSIIGPFSADSYLGNIQVNYLQSLQTISGSVTDCNSNPLMNGIVIITLPRSTIYADVNNGNFSTSFASCNPGATVTLIAVDQSTQQQGNPVNVPLTSSIVNVGTLLACGAAAGEFITLEVDGITRTWTVAPYDFYAQEFSANGGFHELYVGTYDTSSTGSVDLVLFRSVDSSIVPFSVGIESMAVYDPLAAPNMLGDYFADNTTPAPPLVYMTEYGAIGQFIAGSFSGSFIRNFNPTVDTVYVNCNFRIRRE